MPELGEVRRGREIEKSPGRAYIWHACIDCGKERWTVLKMGEPESLRCMGCNIQRNKGVNHTCWHGGRFTVKRTGYIKIKLFPDDFFYPMTDTNGYVFEHRLVVAKALGRCLHRWELIHHKKSYARDNNQYPQTLQLVQEMQHNQITIMENHIKNQDKLIKKLQSRVTLLEAELVLLRNCEKIIAVRVR